jgi:hypothetical protein
VKRVGVSKPISSLRRSGWLADRCGSYHLRGIASEVSRQTIYDWINERRVERLIDALRLSCASGVAIENLAGDDVEKLATPVQTPPLKRRARRISPDSPGL